MMCCVIMVGTVRTSSCKNFLLKSNLISGLQAVLCCPLWWKVSKPVSPLGVVRRVFFGKANSKCPHCQRKAVQCLEKLWKNVSSAQEHKNLVKKRHYRGNVLTQSGCSSEIMRYERCTVSFFLQACKQRRHGF